MIRLEIDNIRVFLKPNTSFTIKMRNPAFNNEGTFSYPVNALVERNRALMKHLEAEDNFTGYNPQFKMWIDDELFMEGDVKIIEATSVFQFYLKSGKSSAVRILKESYLDGQINGQSWGDAPGGLTDINASPNAVYPVNKFVVAPIKLDDFVINEWDVTNQDLKNTSLGEGEFTPMVYIGHLIDRINQALNLLNEQNDFSLKEDFKRLALFSPRKGNYAADALTQYKEWLPHITANEFLNDLEARFNIVPFFNQLLFSVDYIKFDSILSGSIIDWTNRYIRDDEVKTFQRGLTILKNDAEDDDALSPREIEEKYDLVEVADYDDMTFLNEFYKVTNVGRYFQRINKDFENDITQNYYADTTPQLLYKLKTEPFDSTAELTNGDTTPGQDNIIVNFGFDVLKGYLTDNVDIRNIEAKTDAASDVELVIKVGAVGNGYFTVKTEKRVTINNTAYQFYNILIELIESFSFERILDNNGNFVSGEACGVWFYAYHPTTARTITLRFGEVAAPVPELPYTIFTPDTNRQQFKQIGVIGNYEFGDIDAEKVEIVEPDSKVLYNGKERNDEFLFQMPLSDIEPEIEQTDYAYVVYRGKINDERDGTKIAPYANFDELDLEMNDYQSRVTVGSTPDLSLRWHGTNGIGNLLWRQRVIWFQNYHRPVRKIVSLTLHDLLQVRMYNRIRINNVLYVINEISVKVNVNGDLSQAELDLFTV